MMLHVKVISQGLEIVEAVEQPGYLNKTGNSDELVQYAITDIQEMPSFIIPSWASYIRIAFLISNSLIFAGLVNSFGLAANKFDFTILEYFYFKY